MDPITDGCEPPHHYWELNLGPLEEHSVLLTTESSLQPDQGNSYKEKHLIGADLQIQRFSTLSSMLEAW